MLHGTQMKYYNYRAQLSGRIAVIKLNCVLFLNEFMFVKLSHCYFYMSKARTKFTRKINHKWYLVIYIDSTNLYLFQKFGIPTRLTWLTSPPTYPKGHIVQLHLADEILVLMRKKSG